MPDALTDLQSEYLEFIRKYIKGNKGAPQLKEIAAHFHVTSPTATKTLSDLQEKGYLHFNRAEVGGFYIRLLDRETPLGIFREISTVGYLDQNGEVLQFPQKRGHFPYVLPDGTGDVFALDVADPITFAGLYPMDRMIFTMGGEAEPGDICIFPIGKRYFLVKMFDYAQKEGTMLQPLVRKWIDSGYEHQGRLFWWPFVLDERNEKYQSFGKFFLNVMREEKAQWFPVEPQSIVGKAIRQSRKRAFYRIL